MPNLRSVGKRWVGSFISDVGRLLVANAEKPGAGGLRMLTAAVNTRTHGKSTVSSALIVTGYWLDPQSEPLYLRVRFKACSRKLKACSPTTLGSTGTANSPFTHETVALSCASPLWRSSGRPTCWQSVRKQAYVGQNAGNTWPSGYMKDGVIADLRSPKGVAPLHPKAHRELIRPTRRGGSASGNHRSGEAGGERFRHPRGARKFI